MTLRRREALFLKASVGHVYVGILIQNINRLQFNYEVRIKFIIH